MECGERDGAFLFCRLFLPMACTHLSPIFFAAHWSQMSEWFSKANRGFWLCLIVSMNPVKKLPFRGGVVMSVKRRALIIKSGLRKRLNHSGSTKAASSINALWGASPRHDSVLFGRATAVLTAFLPLYTATTRSLSRRFWIPFAHDGGSVMIQSMYAFAALRTSWARSKLVE